MNTHVRSSIFIIYAYVKLRRQCISDRFLCDKMHLNEQITKSKTQDAKQINFFDILYKIDSKLLRERKLASRL